MKKLLLLLSVMLLTGCAVYPNEITTIPRTYPQPVVIYRDYIFYYYNGMYYYTPRVIYSPNRPRLYPPVPPTPRIAIPRTDVRRLPRVNPETTPQPRQPRVQPQPPRRAVPRERPPVVGPPVRDTIR